VAGLVRKNSNRKTSIESFINFIDKVSNCKTEIANPAAASDGTIVVTGRRDVYVTFTLFPKNKETPQYVLFFCSGEKQRSEFIEFFAKLSIIPYMYGHDAFYI
jgi:hypothetical protein